MPNSPEDIYQAERNTLVRQLTDLAECDERIRAAWLFGSLGRGTADVLSDIDVFFIVADDHLPAVISARQRLVTDVGEAFLTVEAPQNAPKDGAYLMAWYRGEHGPHEIDWYWQPQSQAVLPSETFVLCDKDKLPRKSTATEFDGYQPTPEMAPLEAAQNAFDFFWAMLWITGKYAARSPHEKEMSLLRYTLNAYNDVSRFLNKPEIPVSEESLIYPFSEAKFHCLKEQVRLMEILLPELKQKGIAFSPQVISQSDQFIGLLSHIVLSKTTSTQRRPAT